MSGKKVDDLLSKARKGFSTLDVDKKYQDKALSFLEQWLSKEEFGEYQPQLEYMIENQDWDYLLDCFYQIIPFGTGGRRGEVGIGPNRINKWTIRSSAQGHSQYLIKQHGDDALEKGVVLAYGVREFIPKKHYSDKMPNPVKNLKGVDLAEAAAEVYTANGLKTYLFDGPRTTPELSFAIRYLDAIAGDMFDASHNPPEHSGKKVYDQYGGQLIPPDDEALVIEVTQKVEDVKTLELQKAKEQDLLVSIGEEVDKKYYEQLKNLSLTDNTDLKIVYTPLHGVGKTSVFEALKELGYDIILDPKTGYFSGKFENVTYNIPNPEVRESFDTTLELAKKENADILLNSDPDADRIGVMVNHDGDWRFLNGNEIGVMLMQYVIDKRGEKASDGHVIQTLVTTSLASKIAKVNEVKIIDDLPVGFKYIADEMNKLEEKGEIDDFLLGLEESHGYIAGNYLRDKDAAVGAIWLANLAAELKDENKTLVDYLNQIYSKYGYFRNYLTEIRLPGAEGMGKIRKIQDTLREKRPMEFNGSEVEKIEDLQDRKPIVSETDKKSKDVLVFHFSPPEGYQTLKVTVRPSGTEPKTKFYIEIGTAPFEMKELESIKQKAEELLRKVEKSVMDYCFEIIGVDFPERGYLLFWQLPLKDKLHYFDIEQDIADLKEVEEEKTRQQKLDKLLEFLGTDPIEKIDTAFEKKYGSKVSEYLNLNG